MSSALCLPGTSDTVKQRVNGSFLADLPNEIPTDAGALSELFRRFQSVSQVVGSARTPLVYWLAAQRFLPNAELIQQEESQGTQRIRIQAKEQATKSAPPEVTPKPEETAPEPQSPPVNQNTINQWIFDTYCYYAWGESQSGEQKYREVSNQVPELAQHYPDLPQQLDSAVRHGKHAYLLVQGLDKRIQRGEAQQDIEAWIDRLTDNQPKRVAKSVRRHYEKRVDHQKKARARQQASKGFKLELPWCAPQPGEPHPQSLRALEPSSEWTLLIDESGAVFDETAQSLTERDVRLGRVVAVAVPEKVNLPKLKKAYHAKDESDDTVQKVVKTLMDARVGILGGTLKDDLRSANWISAIQKVIRWALLMLPVEGKTRVRILVEQKEPYLSRQDAGISPLRGIKDLIESDLRQLAPDRFNNLELDLSLMDKYYPLNGYVDTIANLWASPTNTRRRMLARTGWRGHCLMDHTSLDQTDHLYRRVAQTPDDIDPADWFELCDRVSREPGHSLLNDTLERFGQQAAQHNTLWQQCLNQVQRQIQLKQFSPSHLDRALAWLDTHQPEGEKLPGHLHLELESARLAADNHLGRADQARVQRLMTLAQQMKDESPSEACQSALRIAIAATNAFDFTSATPYIEQWLAEPVAVPGLLNHAKLHSTLGQLNAFNGNTEAALAQFDRALQYFAQLSDPRQAERESRQTESYRAIAALSENLEGASDEILTLIKRVTGGDTTKSLKKLARSGTELRFEHYLLMRLLINSDTDISLREHYLSVQEEWQYGEGHPWMLINAYRGWLLMEAGQTEQATALFQNAVDGCREDSSTAILHWMGDVLAALGVSLGLALDAPDTNSWQQSPFPASTLEALRGASTHEQRHGILLEALPFNFH